MNDYRSMEKDIIQIIAKELAVPESAVVPEARILDHLAADSLDTVFLILTLEEKFHIEIPDKEAASIQTVKDMFAIVRAKHSSHHCRVKGNFSLGAWYVRGGQSYDGHDLATIESPN